MNPIRIGIIGAGRIGRVHAANLARRIPGAEVVVVVDPSEEAAKACAAELGVASWSTDVATVIDDPWAQALVIASPTDTHTRIIMEAAAAGKDLFCEKPIDLALDRVDAALAAVARAGVKLQIGFNRRFDPSFARARLVVASGGIGDPHLLRITSRDPQPPPAEYLAVSGGLFADMTIHDFDMARWILGDEPVEIMAAGAILVDPAIGRLGDIDTAVVTIRMSRGTLVTIDNSRRSVYGYDVRLEAFGSGGSVRVDNVVPTSVVHTTAGGATGDTPPHWFIERFAEAYLAEMHEFVRCLQEDRNPSVTGIDGRVPLVMAHAARQSLDESRAVRIESPS